MTTKSAFADEYNVIQSIAHKTWPETYGTILSPEQLSYMLGTMYSLEALNKNREEGVHFILAEENGRYFGFGGFQHAYKGEQRTHIHKIYVLPEAQGLSVGKMLMLEMERQAVEIGSCKVTLNVNRHNKARHFYEKMGYRITETVDIEIGNGYLMEDYVMEKRF